MKSKLRLTEIAVTVLAAAYVAGCGSSSKSTGGAGGSGDSGTGGSGAGGSAVDAGKDATGPTDGNVVDTNGDALPGACVTPTGTSPSGTAPLQAAGPAVASTATRPQFDQTTSDANYTITKFLAAGGSVASSFVSGGQPITTFTVPMVDNWDPVTVGIGDVSTFTPMFTVSADGTGTHKTIGSAITAARLVTSASCARAYILVKPGTYRETVVVPNKNSSSPITLYGSDPDASHTVIVFNNASLTTVAGAALGTSGSATFTNSSLNFQAKNLTFANDYMEAGAGNEQAVALLNQGDRAQFENVRALGNQDTLYVKTVNTGTVARAYFRDSYVEGDTDFIFGRGTTVFDHCEIHTTGTNKNTNGTPKITGTATGAPSTEVSNTYGFLYISSKFTADDNVTAGGTYLARQWYESSRPQAVGKMIVRNSTLGPHINATMPWQPWAGRMILAPYPDGGAPGDGGADAGAQPTAPGGTLYTSDDYYALIGGGPSPAEPYIGEYGNTGAAPGTVDGGPTPTDAGAPDAPSDAPTGN